MLACLESCVMFRASLNSVNYGTSFEVGVSSFVQIIPLAPDSNISLSDIYTIVVVLGYL